MTGLASVGYLPWTRVALFLAWAAVAAPDRVARGRPVRAVRRRPRDAAARRRAQRRPPGRAGRSGEAQVAHEAPAGQLAGPGRDVDEGIGPRGSDDHVRLLPGDRQPARHPPASIRRSSPGRACRGRGSRRTGEASRRPRNAAAGRPRPCSASRAGRTKRRAPTSADTGLPGKPEDERPPADAERDRLAGLDCDAPEDLLDAKLGLDAPNEVVLPTDTPPEVTRTSASRPRCERRSGARSRRRRQRAHVDVGPGDRRARLEHDAVRLVDLAGRELGARRAQLGARRQHGDARTAAAVDRGEPDRSQRADLSRAEPRPGRKNDRRRPRRRPRAA